MTPLLQTSEEFLEGEEENISISEPIELVIELEEVEPEPEPEPEPEILEEGIASWYGEPFHGRRTASGEVFDMNSQTAAHRTLKFGTVVRVTSSRSGRSTDVRINDRGPFVKGRIIDLSAKAAEELGIKSAGVEQVKIEVLEEP